MRRMSAEIQEELLFQISGCLDHYGIESRIVHSWWSGKHIVIGDDDTRSRRAVFKISDDDEMYVDLVCNSKKENELARRIFFKFGYIIIEEEKYAHFRGFE